MPRAGLPASISTGDADSERLPLKCSLNAVGAGVWGRLGRPEAQEAGLDAAPAPTKNHDLKS